MPSFSYVYVFLCVYACVHIRAYVLVCVCVLWCCGMSRLVMLLCIVLRCAVSCVRLCVRACMRVCECGCVLTGRYPTTHCPDRFLLPCNCSSPSRFCQSLSSSLTRSQSVTVVKSYASKHSAVPIVSLMDLGLVFFASGDHLLDVLSVESYSQVRSQR